MKTYNEPKKIVRTYMVEPGLSARLHYCAACLGVSQSSLVNEALRNWLKDELKNLYFLKRK